jgi:predicted AAA+ superfamily ATPase
MNRYLKNALVEDMGEKILLLTGPRQCGKTTLSKMLHPDYQYINYDLAEHRLLVVGFCRRLHIHTKHV